MGTCIDAVAIASPRGRLSRRGALHLSDVAVRRCLTRGHHHAGELDLLVNVGLYKDHSIAEPALASLIQEDIGANPGHPPNASRHGTFSFDLMNGGCGVIDAAYLIDAFLGGGSAKLAMIVAGDSDPTPGSSRHFPFAPTGGALLLRHDDRERGFQRFAFRTFPEHADLFEAAIRWDRNAGILRSRGRNVLEVDEAPLFATHATEHGLEVARELLEKADVSPTEVDLLIASPYPRSFASELARGLGIDSTRVPDVDRAFARAHTAGPIAVLEAAIEAGELARARHTLFVTVGAGISVAAALYAH